MCSNCGDGTIGEEVIDRRERKPGDDPETANDKKASDDPLAQLFEMFAEG